MNDYFKIELGNKSYKCLNVVKHAIHLKLQTIFILFSSKISEITLS